jgi:pyruvate,orthophosphate dikinase
LTDAGKIRARMDLDAARAAWPGADAALGEFIGFDRQVKDLVTSWQMRGETFNDHSDAAYDAAVLGRLAGLHEQIRAWLPARFKGYAARFDRAAAAVAAGDTKFVASPRVDSYHSAWFELHEELILLAGRTRADEVAAGRA